MKRIRFLAPAVLLLIFMVILLPIEGRAEEAAAAIPSIPSIPESQEPAAPAAVIPIPTASIPIDEPEPEEPTPLGGASFAAATEAVMDVWMDVVTESQSQWSYFYFVPEESGFYAFQSSSDDGDPYGMIFNADQVELSHHDDYHEEIYDFWWSYHLVAQQKYYFVIKSLDGPMECQVKLYRDDTGAMIEEATNISSQRSLEVSVQKKWGNQVFFFRPDVTGYHNFYVEKGSSYEYQQLWVYDYQNQLIETVIDNTPSGASLSVLLEADKTYIIVAGYSYARTGNYTMKVLTAFEPKGKGNAVRNADTDLFMDIHGPNAQEYVHQWTFHMNPAEIWCIRPTEDGFYTIQSMYGSKKYIGILSGVIGGDAVMLFSQATAETKWKIYKTASGGYIFESGEFSNYVIYAPNSNVGAELQLQYLTKSGNGGCAWNLETRCGAELEGQEDSKLCWAATARMYANHYLDRTVSENRTQALASRLINNDSNDGGGNDETIMATRYFATGSTTGAFVVDGNEQTFMEAEGRRMTESDLISVLNKGHIVIIGRGEYANSLRQGGHAYLITGYTVVDGVYQYIIYDPQESENFTDWDNSKGRKYLATYDWISHGTMTMGGTLSGYFWDAYIILDCDVNITVYPPDEAWRLT